MELIINNHYKKVAKLINNAKKSLKIVTPFLHEKLVDDLIMKKKNIKIEFITKICMMDFLNNFNSIYAIEKMYKAKVKLYFIRNLHTKLIIVDDKIAIFGSANFTNGGLKNNVELSIKIRKEDDKKIFTQIIEYFKSLTLVVSKKERITKEIIDRIKNEYEKRLNKYNKKNFRCKYDNYGIEIINNKFTSDIKKDNMRRYYFINTNDENCENELCQEDMFKHKRAAAYGSSAHQIDKIKIGDIVFFYKNRIGIVACGKVNSNVKKISARQSVRRLKEHYVDIVDFVKIPNDFKARKPMGRIRWAISKIVSDYEAAEKYYNEIIEKLM